MASLSASLAPSEARFFLDTATSYPEDEHFLRSGEASADQCVVLYVDFQTSPSRQVMATVVFRAGIETELRSLADEWQRERGPTSSALRAAMHPAYLRIIGKGERAVPFLLRELQREPDHWFLALMAITGEDPVPEEARGNIQAMADAWVQWGKTARLV